MSAVQVRYFAGAAEAAGVRRETVAATTVGELLAATSARHGPGFADVLRRCSLLVDGAPAIEAATVLGDGAVVDILPPFAGG